MTITARTTDVGDETDLSPEDLSNIADIVDDTNYEEPTDLASVTKWLIQENAGETIGPFLMYREGNEIRYYEGTKRDVYTRLETVRDKEDCRWALIVLTLDRDGVPPYLTGVYGREKFFMQTWTETGEQEHSIKSSYKEYKEQRDEELFQETIEQGGYALKGEPKWVSLPQHERLKSLRTIQDYAPLDGVKKDLAKWPDSAYEIDTERGRIFLQDRQLRTILNGPLTPDELIVADEFTNPGMDVLQDFVEQIVERFSPTDIPPFLLKSEDGEVNYLTDLYKKEFMQARRQVQNSQEPEWAIVLFTGIQRDEDGNAIGERYMTDISRGEEKTHIAFSKGGELLSKDTGDGSDE